MGPENFHPPKTSIPTIFWSSWVVALCGSSAHARSRPELWGRRRRVAGAPWIRASPSWRLWARCHSLPGNIANNQKLTRRLDFHFTPSQSHPMIASPTWSYLQ